MSSNNCLPEGLVDLQPKSVCFAFRSPMMMTLFMLVRRLSKRVVGSGWFGGTYMLMMFKIFPVMSVIWTPSISLSSSLISIRLLFILVRVEMVIPRLFWCTEDENVLKSWKYGRNLFVCRDSLKHATSIDCIFR